MSGGKKKICHTQKTEDMHSTQLWSCHCGRKPIFMHIAWEQYVPTRPASDRKKSRPSINKKQLWLWEVGHSSSPQEEQFCNVSFSRVFTDKWNWEEHHLFLNILQKKVLISPEISSFFAGIKSCYMEPSLPRASGTYALRHLHRIYNHLLFSLPYTVGFISTWKTPGELQDNETSLLHTLNINRKQTLSFT